MSNKVRSIFGVLIGIVVGGLVNIGLVYVGPMLVPPPAGVDMTTVEGMTAGMQLLGPQHFLAPFLAHALGTFVGALTACFIATDHSRVAAYIVGAFYLLGGIVASTMIPAPLWFIVFDLVAAYIPMAWLALKMGNSLQKGK